ncbi:MULTISPECIES: hypothetical protein [Chryseobacterium]|uniref:Lipoprotein n=1 Tax=Chryseobacterium geocarposphaerae TaxID=1416776 RepID=A0ABU1LDP9_9FLAO|nr:MULTISPECIES: hypothetical protein [Chryseobacterium]MDR6404843.1 hypothetical protein [Chryseobacterium geocarposphaerae]MDR6697626.1 hypothetical protein [Chryseobacterium ginsenosidimutans]
MKKIFIYFSSLLTIIACTKKEFSLKDFEPKTIDEVRKMQLYEYNNVLNLQSKTEKNIFFSNVRPDNLLKYRKGLPLGRLVYINNPKVLEYFDKDNNNTFIYYHFRNDSLISKLYLKDNFLSKDKSTITNINQVNNLFNNLNLKYAYKDIYSDSIINKRYNISSTVRIDGEKTLLLDNKYPTIVYATDKLFYVEVIYNKLMNGTKYNWMLEK